MAAATVDVAEEDVVDGGAGLVSRRAEARRPPVVLAWGSQSIRRAGTPSEQRGGGEVDGGIGLADSALLIDDTDDFASWIESKGIGGFGWRAMVQKGGLG